MKKTKTLSAVEQKNIEQNFSKFTLYGMVITDDSAEALVSCPTTPLVFKRGTKPKRTQAVKQTKWVKAGDALDDFKVVAVKPDRVLLEAGGESYDLLLYGNEQVKNRGSAKPKPGPTVLGASVNAPIANVNVKKDHLFLNHKEGAGSDSAVKRSSSGDAGEYYEGTEEAANRRIRDSSASVTVLTDMGIQHLKTFEFRAFFWAIETCRQSNWLFFSKCAPKEAKVL